MCFLKEIISVWKKDKELNKKKIEHASQTIDRNIKHDSTKFQAQACNEQLF